MNCPLCRHGVLQPGTADETLSFEGTTLVVKDAPALICDTCGEPYFDEQVTQRLLDLAREAAANGVVVDVRRYVAAA
ncbi:MAG: type II toxin-antitoxin system MqsA family antitoxin [Acidimicrobiales bacterium]